MSDRRADHTVEIINREVDVYDSSVASELEEIKELLKQILARLPANPGAAPK